mmetsp:Transcript_22492/g.27754  ORF Transcript_22492/g.27754 Transcript_22492/m.27754 type:complete len:227 (-) Transcript_22492:27-707(-)
MKERHLNDFSDLFNLVLAATQIVVSDIWLVLDRHHGDSGVNLGGQGQHDLDLGVNLVDATAANSHTLLDISRSQILAQSHHVLAVVLESDDILGFGGAWVQDLRQATHLQRWALLLHLPVAFNVPLSWEGETGIRLLDALHFDNFLVKSLDLILDLLEGLRVGPLAVTLEEQDVALAKGVALVVLHLVLLVLLGSRVILLRRGVDLRRLLLFRRRHYYSTAFSRFR